MNKFKVGDRVRSISAENHNGNVGTIRRVDTTSVPYLVELEIIGSWWFAENSLERVGKSAKRMKPKQPQFLLQYEIDSDPWEEFQTLSAVRKRIKELEEEGAHSYKVYEIKSVKEVVISKRIEIK